MKEFVLHYVWQHRLFIQHDLVTTDGRRIKVIDVGKLNMHAGPDFFNAKIKIDDTIWAGNVEIHMRSSDWNKHEHQLDANYKNVILHVVKRADIPVFLPDGQLIPQLEIEFSQAIADNIDELLLSAKWIACEHQLHKVDKLYWNDWKTTLIAERMISKTYEIYDLLAQNDNFWEQTCFIILAKSFGFSVNSEGFLQLAKSIPWQAILKSSDRLIELEALLYGQAGLLIDCNDVYIQNLQAKYKVLQLKHYLKPTNNQLWHMLRLRPDNFPHIRIAQLAALLYSQTRLFQSIINAESLNHWIEMLAEIKVSNYWKTHYLPGEKSKKKDKHLGIQSIYSILINAFIPLLFSYGDWHQNEDLKVKAFEFLEQIPAENNYITRKWKKLDIKMRSAADSQALLHLYKNYCDAKNCLRCRIGYKVLTSSLNQINQ